MGRTLNGSVASLKEAHFSKVKGIESFYCMWFSLWLNVTCLLQSIGFYRTYDLVKGKSTDKLQVVGRVDYAVRVKGVCWGVTEVETLVVSDTL